jgi:hypothetical protein
VRALPEPGGRVLPVGRDRSERYDGSNLRLYKVPQLEKRRKGDVVETRREGNVMATTGEGKERRCSGDEEGRRCGGDLSFEMNSESHGTSVAVYQVK